MLSHYVIVRRDLPPGVQLAYAVHAAGESTPERVPEGTRAVVLAVPDAEGLESCAEQIASAEVDHTIVREDGEAFAIGFPPASDLSRIRQLTSALPLAG